jgi:hypothetical protein
VTRVLVIVTALLSIPDACAGIWTRAWSAASFRRDETKELRWAHHKAFLRHLRGY